MTDQESTLIPTDEPKIEHDQDGFVKDTLCPNCEQNLKLHHTDDVGTQFFQCEKCSHKTSKTKALQQFEANLEKESIEETVEVGNRIITPFLENPIIGLHPAIGEINDMAYVGVWIPCLENHKGNVQSKELLWLILSNREKILADNEALLENHCRLTYKPIHFQNRWNLKDVQTFLNGKNVNASDVFHQVLNLYKEFIEFPDSRLYYYHTLWTIGTYFHHLFSTYPYLYVGGIKRSGKSKTLRLHFCLDFNAVFSGNMSSSSIYRLIQNNRATLLIDETEKLANPKRAVEFRSILLSGYQKGAAVFRVEKTRKDRLEPETFEVYSPKGLANITGLEDVLEDRCIMTFQKRSVNKVIVNHEINIQDPRFREVRSELYTFFLLHWKEIKEIYHNINECSELSALVNLLNIQTKTIEGYEYLSSRELELWKCIFSLSLFFNKDNCSLTKYTTSPSTLCSLMFSLACSQAAQRHTENMTETGEEILVSVLSTIADSEISWVKVKAIKEKMSGQFGENQPWLTSRWVGSALRRLGFSSKRRVGTGYEYEIAAKVVEDLCQRMQIPELKGKGHAPETTQEPLFTSCYFCHKPISKDNWVTDEFTEHKPAHQECYDEQKSRVNSE